MSRVPARAATFPPIATFAPLRYVRCSISLAFCALSSCRRRTRNHWSPLLSLGLITHVACIGPPRHPFTSVGFFSEPGDALPHQRAFRASSVNLDRHIENHIGAFNIKDQKFSRLARITNLAAVILCTSPGQVMVVGTESCQINPLLHPPAGLLIPRISHQFACHSESLISSLLRLEQKILSDCPSR